MKHLRAFALCLLLMTVFLQSAVCEALPAGGLTCVRYTCSGDEYGNTYREELERAEDGSLLLTVTESPTFDSPQTVTRFRASEDAFSRIEEITAANGMTAWAERPDELEVCDAAHPYLHLEFTDADGKRESFDISGYIPMSEEESAAYDAVLGILRECAVPENLTEGT